MMNPTSPATSRVEPISSPVGLELVLPDDRVTLSNGRYRVQLRGGGSGRSECDPVAITRWLPQNREVDGFHIFIRDLDSQFIWSAGFQPTCVWPAEYSFQCQRNIAEIRRVDHRIECRLSVCVSPVDEFEVRCCQLTNHGDMPRNLDLTSYLEWVLTRGDADASHPAFSKLFVETSFCETQQAIFARRRPRSAEESELWGFHALRVETEGARNQISEFETNRVCLIGRGRTLRSPLALEPGCHLSGEQGPVLDPIASLRTTVRLEPGQTQRVAFVLGGGTSRERVDQMLAGLVDFDSAIAVMKSVAGGDGEVSKQSFDATPVRHPMVQPPHFRLQNNTAGLPHDPSIWSATDVGRFPKASINGDDELLEFDNGYGGFSADGREYVVRLRPDGRGRLKRPPAPWVNVIANDQAGFLVSESAAGYTWAGNSRENRLTTWHNDPVSDPHCDGLWIRDEESGVFWSPTPGPTPAMADYRVRHGFGYTTFEHTSHDLLQETTMFVPCHGPVKLTHLRIENTSDRTRRLSLFSYVEWGLAAKSDPISIDVDETRAVAWATNESREHYGGYVAFSAFRPGRSAAGDVYFTCDQESFLGHFGDLNAPAAIANSSELDCRALAGRQACTAWQVDIEIPPGGVYELSHLLGESSDRTTAIQLLDRFAEPSQVKQALAEVKQFWRDTLSAIEIETPARELDLMVNGWLVYQNLSCRMWGRSAYYQPGGAYGFRDQLQDSTALIYHRPDLTRAQILRHAAKQFVEGDVLHWWHPDTQYGLRTRFSDDLLWLPLVTAEYVKTTGDAAILNEELPFLSAPVLNEGQQEAFLLPGDSENQGTLYEHCCRALDRGLTRGRHGLPLIGCGDWNDGFSRIGREGKGESVWLGFFIDVTLGGFLPLCAERGDDVRVARYEAYRQQLRESLNLAGWDGAWYRRAYYDHGEPIGSCTSDECRIDALVQAWSVLSGVAPAERVASSIGAVESQLIDDEAGIIRLLTPPFDRTPYDPGYIKGYLPGIRENGGQYTHGVLWAVRAIAQLGRGSRAVELLRKLTPVWHGASRERADLYHVEPYVVAADIYGEPPHVGRGGWTWYTGSAGWMFRVAVESILGLSIERGERLVINPCISAAWPQCRLTYRIADSETIYNIFILNPRGKERVVQSAVLNGSPVEVNEGRVCIPLAHDGQRHCLEIEL